jgi:two-component sensor histidine kinase
MAEAGLRNYVRNIGIVLSVILAFELVAGLLLLDKAREHSLYLLDSRVERFLDQARYVIQSGVSHLDHTVGVLAGSPWILPALNDPSLLNKDRARSVLKRYCRVIEADVCYLMNHNGAVIAASNNDRPESFESHDYGFRSYFKDALAGRSGFFIGRGVTSLRRGYYTAHSVCDEGGRAVGVVVMKRNILDVERRFAGEFTLLITDDHGGILLSSQQNMADAEVFPYYDQMEIVGDESKVVGELPRMVVWGGRRYYVYRQPAFLHNWTAFVLVPAEYLSEYWMWTLGITGLVLLLTVVIAALFFLRRMRRELVAAREAGMMAEKQVQETACSLAEKEALLKEIHHRVKNNLQVISSLLSLQARFSNDERLCRILAGSQTRIYSMAAIHEYLYRNQTLRGIDFALYVQALLEQLKAVIGSASSSVVIETDVESMIIDVDQAIPCGLIVNELVSNALRHAFHPKGGGTIRITFTGDDGTGNGRLCICDDGVGMPEGALDFRNGLGLTLVKALVSQLEGSVNFDYTRGTCICIKFIPKAGKL